MGISSKQKFLSGLNDEDEILFAHLYDLACRSEKYGCAMYGDFLSEHAQSELRLRKNHLPQQFFLFGGHDGSERCMAAFAPDEAFLDYPIEAVIIRSSHISELSHRDFLGSIMGLGIKREKCGDIIVMQDKCAAFMTPQAAQTVDRELLKVGRIGVSTEISDAASIELPPPSFKEIRGTVASLRLDALLSLLCGTGRGNTGELIRGGRVFVNGICASKGDMRLSGGEIISVRGFGRARLEIGGISRKDRIFVTLNKYV